MIVEKDKNVATFYIVMKPENGNDNQLLLEMIREKRWERYLELNGQVRELTVHIPIS